MKYLVILLLFLSACSNVERVGDHDTVQRKVSVVETSEPEIVKIKEPVQLEKVDIKENIDHLEGIHFKVLSPLYDKMQTVKKIVGMRRANKFDIIKVWWTYNVFENEGDLLDQDDMEIVVVTVQSQNKDDGLFTRHFVKVVEVKKSRARSVENEMLELGERKFYELLTKVVRNEIVP